MLNRGIDYVACGYCLNESVCKIRNEYMKSGQRRAGGTSELAKKCGSYKIDRKSFRRS